MSILSRKNFENELLASLFRDDRIQKIIVKIELCMDKIIKESAKLFASCLHSAHPFHRKTPK